MAVRSVTPWVSPDNRSQGQPTGSTATLWYTVLVDQGDGPNIAEAGTGFGYGSPLPGDSSGRRCNSIEANLIPDANKDAYRVAVNFNSAGEFELNPLLRKFRPQLDFEESREPNHLDGEGIAIVNSAGQSFDPGPDQLVDDTVITLVQNMDTFRNVRAKQMIQSVNTDSFCGADPGELKITGHTIQPLEENGIKYYQEVTRITQRENRTIGGKLIVGWAELRLDEGRYAAFDSDGSPAMSPILDKDGDPVLDPVPMNGGGYALKDAAPDPGPLFVVANDGGAVFRIIYPRKFAAFADFEFVFEV